MISMFSLYSDNELVLQLIKKKTLQIHSMCNAWPMELYNFMLDVKPSICKAQHNLIHVIASLAERRNREGGDQLA